MFRSEDRRSASSGAPEVGDVQSRPSVESVDPHEKLNEQDYEKANNYPAADGAYDRVS
jgi:hypothetical protein